MELLELRPSEIVVHAGQALEHELDSPVELGPVELGPVELGPVELGPEERQRLKPDFVAKLKDKGSPEYEQFGRPSHQSSSSEIFENDQSRK